MDESEDALHHTSKEDKGDQLSRAGSPIKGAALEASHSPSMDESDDVFHHTSEEEDESLYGEDSYFDNNAGNIANARGTSSERDERRLDESLYGEDSHFDENVGNIANARGTSSEKDERRFDETKDGTTANARKQQDKTNEDSVAPDNKGGGLDHGHTHDEAANVSDANGMYRLDRCDVRDGNVGKSTPSRPLCVDLDSRARPVNGRRQGMQGERWPGVMLDPVPDESGGARSVEINVPTAVTMSSRAQFTSQHRSSEPDCRRNVPVVARTDMMGRNSKYPGALQWLKSSKWTSTEEGRRRLRAFGSMHEAARRCAEGQGLGRRPSAHQSLSAYLASAQTKRKRQGLQAEDERPSNAKRKTTNKIDFTYGGFAAIMDMTSDAEEVMEAEEKREEQEEAPREPQAAMAQAPESGLRIQWPTREGDGTLRYAGLQGVKRGSDTALQTTQAFEAGTTFLLCGRPLDIVSTELRLETKQARNVWLLRDDYGHSKLSGRRDRLACCYGDIVAFDMTPSVEKQDVTSIWCVEEHREPNAMFWGNALILIKELAAGDFVRVGFSVDTKWRPYSNHLRGEQWRPEQRPPPPSTFSIPTHKQMMEATQTLLAAQLELSGDSRAKGQALGKSLQEAVERGLVPRMITSFMVTPEVERHPAMRFAVSKCSIELEEEDPGTAMRQQWQAAFKTLVEEREIADHTLCFKIFEIFITASLDLRSDMAVWQRKSIALGKAALERDKQYLKPLLNHLLDSLFANHDSNEKLANALCYAVGQVLAKNGYAAHTILARWFEANEADVRMEFKKASESFKTAAAEWRRLGFFRLQTLPLTLAGWEKACAQPKQPELETMQRDDVKGMMRWTLKDDPSEPERKVPDLLKNLAWNANGLSARVQDGDFARLLQKHNPDVLSISEVKCTPDKLREFDVLLRGLAAIGYRDVVWNWSPTKPDCWGMMVLSKYKLSNVQMGLADDDTDGEGRVIRAQLAEAQFVFPYVPASPILEADQERRRRRPDFDAAFEKLMAGYAETCKPVFIVGDTNLAPRVKDSSLSQKRQERCPSTTKQERVRHSTLMQNANLIDAMQDLNGEDRLVHTWTGVIPRFGQVSMRIDHVWASEGATGTNPDGTPSIVAAAVASDNYKSDHQPILWQLAMNGKHLAAPWPENAVRRETMRANARVVRNLPHGDLRSIHKVNKERMQKASMSAAARQEMESHWAEARKNLADGMVLATQRRKQLPAFDAAAWCRTWEEVEVAQMAAKDPRRAGKRSNRRSMRTDTYTAYDNGKLAQPTADAMPEIDLRIRQDDGGTKKLVALADSGAFFNMITEKEARRLNLKVERQEDSCKKMPLLMAANYGCISVTGTVEATLEFGDGDYLNVEFFVVTDCPYSAILGGHFLRCRRGHIDFEHMEVVFESANTMVRVPFSEEDLRKDMVSVSAVSVDTCTIKPGQYGVLPVKIPFCDTVGCAKWGIIEDAGTCGLSIAAGLSCVGVKGFDEFAVKFVNHTGLPIRITPDMPIAKFTPFADTEDYTIIETDYLEKAEGALPVLVAQASELDEESINAQWEKLPHLHDTILKDVPDKATLLRLKMILIKLETLWSQTPKPPAKGVPEYVIKLDSQPKETYIHRPMNPNVRKQVREVIQKMLLKKVIEPSESRFASPLQIIPKKGNAIRVVNDYRVMNSHITREVHTLPDVQDCLASLHGNRYFTVVDLKDAFWTCPLAEESRKYTAFLTPDGLYQYRRVPQGMKTSTAVFCRFVDRMLGVMKWTNVLTFVDDLLIFSKDIDSHLDIIEKVCTKLHDHNMTLSAAKCHFMAPKVGYLGHIVSRDGVAPDPKRVEAIEALTLPSSKKEMYQRLGKLRYYRRYIRNYGDIEQPLRAKLQSDKAWSNKDADGNIIYTDQEREAFQTLKTALTHEPILCHPDWDKPFILHTDASNMGLGATLLQDVDGKENVICYASRTLTSVESRYSTWELEALAIVWAVRLWNMYLQCGKFTIVTDSKAAQHMLTLKGDAGSGRLLRWALVLQDYDFELKTREGKRHMDADGLSRSPIQSDDPYNLGPTNIEPRGVLSVKLLPNNKPGLGLDGGAAFFPPEDREAWTTEEFLALQATDADCKRLRSKVGKVYNYKKSGTTDQESVSYVLNKHGLLCRKPAGKAWLQVVVPLSLRAFVLRRYHGLPVSGHLGQRRVLAHIEQSFYWPRMKTDVVRWIRACLVCARRKTTRNMHAAEPGRVSTATKPWETISIDIVSASKTANTGHKKILTVLDLFSRWLIAIPLRRATAKYISEALFAKVFCQFGKPKRIHSDKGPEFVNEVIDMLCKRWQIQQTDTGGYQPQANPVERVHRFINATMTMLCDKFGENWPVHLPAATFAYNSSTCDATGFTPFELVFAAQKPTLLHELDLRTEAATLGLDEVPDTAVFRQQAANRLHEAYLQVRRKQEYMAMKRREEILAKEGPRQKKRVKYKVSDQVLFWEPAQSKYLHQEDGEVDEQKIKAPSKWRAKWTGPHTITKLSEKSDDHYEIWHREKGTSVIAHANRLKLFQPWSEGVASTSWMYDSKRSYKCGDWVDEGSLVVVPLERPYPFGVAKLLKSDPNGELTLQWLGNKKDDVRGNFELGWLNDKGKPYYAPVPKDLEHKPYTANSDGVCMNQRDVLMHSFSLTETGKLPRPMLRTISTHPNVWWSPERI